MKYLERTISYSMAKKNAANSGSIRKRKDGLWEARFTYKDSFGQPKRGSVYGKTQREVRKKLTEATNAADEQCYHQESTVKMEAWLREWYDTYCTDLKPATRSTYLTRMNTHLIPYIGKVPISELTNQQIQRLINMLSAGDPKRNKKPLAPKTVKNVHGILHKALEQAVICDMLSKNPADHIKLPKVKPPKLKPLMDESVGAYLQEIQKDPVYKNLLFVDLFTGMRQSEILGLQWQDINFEDGTILIQRQLQKSRFENKYFFLDSTKGFKDRCISISPSVVQVLRDQRTLQQQWEAASHGTWSNPDNLVFTNQVGGHLVHGTVYRHFKKIVRSIGMDETRFHDLRHSYAINALQYGDSPKEVCEQLGHFSTAFTMDTYAAVSHTARTAAQARMEQFIQTVSPAPSQS